MNLSHTTEQFDLLRAKIQYFFEKLAMSTIIQPYSLGADAIEKESGRSKVGILIQPYSLK